MDHFEDRELLPEETAELFAALEGEMATAREETDAFAATYGFRHDCVCDDDYREGNVHEVSSCYLKMVDDAMATVLKYRGVLIAIANAGDTFHATVLSELATEALKA